MAAVTQERVREFLAQVEVDARPRPGFYGLIFLASTIATFGLLANSAAVIIGAMLVAPLMSSIVGVALAIVLNERLLLRRATVSLISGALLAWATGMVLTWLSPLTDPGTEILSRVRPTLFDLWIATAAGLAGAYSLLRAPSSAALPGVAIATALIPPLVTAGIETRLMDFSAALGAMLLFLSNMVAITCGGLAVFVFYGLARHGRKGTDANPLRAYAWWSGSFAVLGLLLANSLSQVVTEVRTARTVKETLRSQVRMIPGAGLDRYDLTREGNGFRINAVVATPQSIEPQIVATAERLLASRLKCPVRLIIRSVITKDADATRYLLQKQEDEQPPSDPVDPLVTVEHVLQEQSLALPVSELVDYSVRRQGAGYKVTAVYRTDQPMDLLLVRGLRNLLAEALSAPVELEFRTAPHAPRPEPSVVPPAEGPEPVGRAGGAADAGE